MNMPIVNGMGRREFLLTGGALVVGFALSPHLEALAQAAATKPVALDEVDSYLVIAPDGAITLYSGKVDLGTGCRVAFGQIVAEELDVPFARITMIEGDTATTPDQGTTGGSTGIIGGGMQIRQASATARKALLDMAAQKWNVAAAGLTVTDGVVRSPDGRTAAYGELIAGGRFNVKLDRNAAVKNGRDYKIVGQPVQRPDLPGKMTGRHTYVQDHRIAGMLHARIVRPRAIGATVTSVDEASVRNIPGARVVRIKDFVAVTADSEWNAIRAARALRVSWTGGGGLPGSDRVYASVRAAPVARDQELMKVGDAKAAIGSATRKFQATYEWPAQSHASMGPSCALADFKDGKLTVWSATQGPHRLRQVIARGMGMEADAVRVVYLDGAGCYGMNGHDDAACDAALLSRQLGRPVRVQWSREEEHGWDPKGPPQVLDLRASLDAEGNIVAWESEAWLPINTPNLFNRSMLAFSAAGIPQPEGQAVAQVQGNVYPPYDLPHMSAVVHWLQSTPLRASNLRAPGKLGNVYGVEGFMDELAAAAKRDPLEYRLTHLKDEMGARILRRTAEKMNWAARPSPNPASANAAIATGRALVYVHYKHVDNRMGLGVEVAVERATGRVRVTKITCVYEAGQMINPDAVKNQVEGNIIQAVSRTLHEETIFDTQGVTSVDWRSYPILTIPDAPVLDIELWGSPEDKPMGAGEAAHAPVPGAIGNAVFDAIGVRMRKVPLTPARVRAALAGQA
ncbi:MAG: xanthine dehydrogenase family protein molybdopterin-binding subunit [Alphaproteobacteria bacterium]|nr:xanthine dehydrogenase family protein molybdopterin-binding subunit [Alphaproteobacteria bacterium]